MTYGESNDHVTDDVTWPWKVKVVTRICLEPNISKTSGDSLGFNGPPLGNSLRRNEWSHDWWRSGTPKGQGHDPSMHRALYLESSWRCYL